MAKVTAISSLGWSHYTLYEALPRMAARGFTRVEIASFGPYYCFHFNFASPTPSELKTMLDDAGLTPVALNYFAEFHNAWVPDEIDVFVDQWTRKIVQMAEVGIPMMTMGFGARNDRADQEAQLANAVMAYDRLGEIGRQHGVKMLLEVPHLYGIMPSPQQVYWVFDHLSCDNVGALVDCSHWGIIGYDLEEFFTRLGDRLWHIHLRDSIGPDTADQKQELELTPGKGCVDFTRLAKSLDHAGYAGDVSLEFEYRDMTLPDIDLEYDAGLRHLADCGWEIPAGVTY